MAAAFELICEMNLFNCKYQPPGADPMVFKFFFFFGGGWPPKLEFQERPRVKKIIWALPTLPPFLKKKKSANRLHMFEWLVIVGQISFYKYLLGILLQVISVIQKLQHQLLILKDG